MTTNPTLAQIKANPEKWECQYRSRSTARPQWTRILLFYSPLPDTARAIRLLRRLQRVAKNGWPGGQVAIFARPAGSNEPFRKVGEL